jgi:hypothetical protein
MVMLHVPVTGTGTEHIVKVIFSLANTMFTNLLSSDDITFNEQVKSKLNLQQISQ